MNIIVREAALSDASALAEILVSSWKSAYSGLIPSDDLAKNTDISYRTEMFKKMLADPRGDFYIALDDAVPCGHIMFSKSSDADLSDCAEIVAVYALQEYWGKGVGKVMMQTALEAIKEQGFKNTSLWVLKANLRARRFYEKFGFAPDGTEKATSFSNGITKVRYVLFIDF